MAVHSINTAVIPVAGIGTRMLPATWSIEKCMLPVYVPGHTRLLVDWMVEECAQAGLQRVIFVTTERGQRQLRDYFEHIDSTLQDRYAHLGKSGLVEAERERRQSYKLRYEYVIQNPGAYGTAVPPYVAREVLSGEKRFFLMGGDDFVYHQNPLESELSLAIKTWSDAETDHVIMGKLVDRNDATKLGLLYSDNDKNLSQWVEKPKLQDIPDVPKVTVNVSRYGFSDSIWEYISEEMNTQRNGEHQMTYPVLSALSNGQTFRIHNVEGEYLGGGTTEELINAGRYITKNPKFSI
jgi:UTP--glucose-1-phosphate uridylyltransferase